MDKSKMVNRLLFCILLFSFGLIIPGNSITAIELPPEFLAAMDSIERGDRRKAEELLLWVIQKYPDSGFFYLEYAINCIYLECPDRKIEAALDKAGSLISESPRYYFYKGLYMEGKDREEALRLYDMAISLRPGYVDAIIRACTIYAEKGDSNSALAYYDAIPVEQRKSSLILKMTDFFIENKDYGRAEKGLNELVKRHPENVLYLEKLRDFYNKTGNIKKRDEIATILKRLNPVKKRLLRPLR